VHRDPEGQHMFPQHVVSSGQHPPFGQSRVRFGQPCRLARVSFPFKFTSAGVIGRKALAKGELAMLSLRAPSSSKGCAGKALVGCGQIKTLRRSRSAIIGSIEMIRHLLDMIEVSRGSLGATVL
jgi:hypothetical protein